MLQYLPAVLLIFIGVVYSVKANKLSVVAAMAGAVISAVIMVAVGYTGLLLMTIFFVLGSAATAHKLSFKVTNNLAEKVDEQRSAGQVFANAGVAGGIGLVVLLYPSWLQIGLLLMASAFSAATADTLSSEMGNVYGKHYYNVITFKKAVRGLNGVVSLQGTLFGVLGSCIIALLFCLMEGFDARIALIIIIAGTAGNLFDSFLGATLESKNYISNNAVNFSNTLFGALVALLLSLV